MRTLLHGSAEAEEGVVLHSALPQMLARFGMIQSKDKRVLLLFTLSKRMEKSEGGYSHQIKQSCIVIPRPKYNHSNIKMQIKST